VYSIDPVVRHLTPLFGTQGLPLYGCPDEAVRQRALAEVRAFARAELPGSEEVGAIDSPLAGADGNREFLLVLRRE